MERQAIGLPLLYLIYFFNSEGFINDFETDIVTCEGQSVDPVRFALVGGPGIVGENADGSLLFFHR